jgi:hypothetical protein
MGDDKAKDGGGAKDAAPAKKKGDAGSKPAAAAPVKPLTPLEGTAAPSRALHGSGEGRDRFASNAGAVETSTHSPLPVAAVLYRNITLLDKYVESRDDRFLARALRYANHVRRYLPTTQLRAAAETYVLDGSRRAAVLELLTDATSRRAEPVRGRVVAITESVRPLDQVGASSHSTPGRLLFMPPRPAARRASHE